MAPQTPSAVPPATQSYALPSPAPPHGGSPLFIPLLLFIFLGLCLGYTLSYVLYRIVMAHKRESEGDVLESSDRGVSRFMNGARLTLNLGNGQKSTPSAMSESPNTQMPDEEKPLTDPPRIDLQEAPASSPAESSSTPFIILTPSFSTNPSQELAGVRLQGEHGPTESQASAPSPTPAQQPVSERAAAKTLSQDRAEAIALDPKLAPVQGPLRPLSMVPSPTRKRRTLFGLGFKHVRGHGGDSETGPESQ